MTLLLLFPGPRLGPPILVNASVSATVAVRGKATAQPWVITGRVAAANPVRGKVKVTP